MNNKFWTQEDITIDDIDTEYITNISREIPSSGDLSAPVAAVLAVKFLRAADLCSELIARVSRVVGYRKTEARTEGSKAAMVRSSESTAKGKELDRERDTIYIEAKNKLVDAESLLTFLSNKHNILMAAHYMCRDIVKGDRVGDYRITSPIEDKDTVGNGFTPSID